MADNSEWLYEFLYRGSPNEPGAWHLILMDQIGRQTVLNMQQAEERGFPLPKILDNINANSLVDLDNLRNETQKIISQVNTLEVENQELRATVESMRRELTTASPPPAGEEHADRIGTSES